MLNLCAFRIGQIVQAGKLNVDDVAAQMAAVAQAIGLGRAESAATIRSGLKAGQASPRTIELTNTTASPSTEADALAQDLAALGETDTDNAQRLVGRFGDRLVCTPGKDYLVFDGKCWCRDDQLRRIGFAEKTARAITREAAYLPDPVRSAKRSAFAASSQSKGALDRMLDVAKHRLMKLDRLFDADAFVLNVENGTLDLRTGKLRPHRQTDLITKLVSVAYDPQAACPTFERLVNVALKGDAAVIAYLQKSVGYTLTGAMGEQVFFFLHGPGGTAKSTFINAIRDLLGNYGLHTPTETFMAKQHDTNPFDLPRLEGARMVTAVEVNWTRQIDEARVKALTGGDPITARRIYGDFFEFQPACKLWFAANDLPGVRGTAEAFWRRVRLIPFEVVIPEDERDDKLPEKLRAEWPGILAWAVRGCLAWQCEGLIPPEAVRRGTEGWRRKADHLPRFCNEELILNQQHFTTAHDLFAHYRAWCERHGETPLDVRKFKAALEGHGLSHKRTNSGSVWSGVKLRLQH